MEVDWPYPPPKRMRSGLCWPAPPQVFDVDSSALWGLCDALALYASGPANGISEFGSLADDGRSSPIPQLAPASPPTDQDDRRQIGARWATQANGLALEPLLRALTQLANAAAENIAIQRQLVSECQVHAPLLRLMQSAWARQPLVAERCCRLLHWLSARAPENREVLASHCSPSACGGARSITFVDAVLRTAESHPRSREVMAHALRALTALLPCSRVQEELLRMQPRLLTCLVAAGEALDVVAVRAVCKWLPGVSGQVRQAVGSRFSKLGESSTCIRQQIVVPQLPLPCPCGGDEDVEMDDI